MYQFFVDSSDFDDRCERVVVYEHDFDLPEHIRDRVHLRNRCNKKSHKQLAFASRRNQFIFQLDFWKIDIYRVYNLKQNTTWINSEGKETTCGTSDRCGVGGFAPFGLAGIIKGSAKCFYAYIGIFSKFIAFFFFISGLDRSCF